MPWKCIKDRFLSSEHYLIAILASKHWLKLTRKSKFENRTHRVWLLKILVQTRIYIIYTVFVLTLIENKPKELLVHPFTRVSKTLDWKWLLWYNLDIFFDNLIMQRIRKGRLSSLKLRKMRKYEKRLNRGWLKAKIEMRD